MAKPDVDGLRLLIQLNENIIDGLKRPKSTNAATA